VPKVDAVEIADGRGSATVAWVNEMSVSDDTHSRA